MTWSKRKTRVRVHLIDAPGVSLPSIEGLLYCKTGGEYQIAVPRLLVSPGSDPVELGSQFVCIPAGRVAFYEVLS